MKFKEALKLLKEGKKVRKCSWDDKDCYIACDENDFLFRIYGRKYCAEYYFLNQSDFMSDWEEYKEPLLTDEEKEFLKMVVKMTPYKIGSIELRTNSSTNHDFLVIFGTNGLLIQSKFYVGSYFSNLEIDKVYTLKELGLND